VAASLSLSVAFVRVGFGTRRDVMRRTGTRRSTAHLRLKRDSRSAGGRGAAAHAAGASSGTAAAAGDTSPSRRGRQAYFYGCSREFCGPFLRCQVRTASS
jgi:hypothetical protein